MVWENKNIEKPMQNDSAALKNSLNAKSYYVDVFSNLIWKSHTQKKALADKTDIKQGLPPPPTAQRTL